MILFKSVLKKSGTTITALHDQAPAFRHGATDCGARCSSVAEARGLLVMAGRYFRHILTALVVFAACLMLLASSGCGKKHRRFPEGEIGWHSPSYNKIFGKLQLVAAAKETEKNYWVIRYASTTGPDIYGGRMVLMPDSMMIGYAGGEYVQLTGRVRQDLKNAAGTGMLYEVQGIRIWVGHESE